MATDRKRNKNGQFVKSVKKEKVTVEKTIEKVQDKKEEPKKEVVKAEVKVSSLNDFLY